MMIKSKLLEKMQPKMKEAAKLIRDAIENKEPIILRHDSDTDGYSAAFALERAILPLIYERHTRERDIYFYYTRSPCKTPWYDFQDALRDVTNFMANISRFEHKHPLIIICDNGASKQDYLAIKLAKIYGAKVLVIDHHPPANEIDKVVDCHLNPHHFASDYDYCTGMLCAEVASMLVENNGFELIAAVSATGDKVKSDESAKYIELAKKSGYDEQTIRDIAKCIDFTAFELVVISNKEIINDLLGADKKKQKELLGLFKKEIDEKIGSVFGAALKYADVVEEENKFIVKIPVDKVKDGRDYPTKGRVAGLMLDHFKEKKDKPIICLGVSPTGINFRSSIEIEGFDVNDIIAKLQKEFPFANVSGGGHRVAGSIRFIEAAHESILNFVLEYCKKAK